jgi:primosomal protein N' (replication factor Y)
MKNIQAQFVKVWLLSGWQEPLWYKVPDQLRTSISVNSFVEVPLRTQKLPALVQLCANTPQHIDIAKLREVISVFSIPQDALHASFIQKIANFYFVSPTSLYQRFIAHIQASPEAIDEAPEAQAQAITHITLSDEQAAAIKKISPHITQKSHKTFLLHGVTGSGKTEVYKKLIQRAIEQKKSVICLFPEVALALQFQAIFKAQLATPHLVFSFHSSSKISEKKTLWNNLLNNIPSIILGVHLPVLLPISNLGLIIIDEEHERGFQEKRHPKINSKEMALWRAQLYDCPIILGSATPSLATLYRTQQGLIEKCTLSQRFQGKFPQIIHASLKENTRKRASFWITKELEAGIKERLTKNEQTILYLNRRGYSFSAQCQDCGAFVTCDSCSVSLTPHEVGADAFTLSCHYCGYSCKVPTTCPSCKKTEHPLIMKGIGTQQLTTIIKKLFPTARIARADLDSTKKKREWLEDAEKFKRGEIDILIGTQLITKGYHFPKVTLVGIVWADLGLAIPDYHTRESVLQKLIQVAGRAGREQECSQVIIQSMSNDSLFSYINEERYPEFCMQELEIRKELAYPPFSRLIQIEFLNKDEKKLIAEIAQYKQTLQKIIQEKNLSIVVLGPTEPLIKKIAGVETRHLFLRSKTFQDIQTLINMATSHKQFSSSIFVTPT